MRHHPFLSIILGVGAWLIAVGAASGITAGNQPYDPMHVPDTAPSAFDLNITDTARNRVFPVRIYSSATQTSAAPVILFSHGLGGSRTGYAHFGQHWAKRGYVVVMLQHPGSDDSVWRGQAATNRKAALQDAAGAENLRLRAGDVAAALDALAQFQQTAGHPLYQRLLLDRIGMSGHSFGARTTQVVSGEVSHRRTGKGADPRIKAALALSPSIPSLGDPKSAYGSVDRPWMLMTGTNDTAPIGNTTPEDRLKVFPALPPGGKYQLVFDGGDHKLFSGRSGTPQQQRATIGISTAFWDCWLRGNKDACGWLDDIPAHGVLAAGDRWQQK